MKKRLLTMIAGVAIFAAANTSVLAEQAEIQNDSNMWNLANYGVADDPFMIWNNQPTEGKYQNILFEDLFENKTITAMMPIAIKEMIEIGMNDKNKTEPTETASIDVEKSINNPAPVETTVNPEAENTNIQVNDEPVTLDTEMTTGQTPAETVNPEPAGKEITVTATAYTADCEGCIGITKTGVNLIANPDAKVIAVDPAIIPLGSKVYVEGFGYATAEDIGGGIDGREIDIFMPEKSDALQWGRKDVTVTIID